MEDLALIASLMVLIPVVIGIAAVGFAIYYRFSGKMKFLATTFTALSGAATGFLMFTYAPIAIIGAVPLVAGFLMIYLPRNSKK